MNRSGLVAAALGLIAATTGLAQDCAFPWTITVTPAGGQTVAVNVCGSYAGCQPHNPQFTIAGSQINVTLTGAVLPDCICLAVQGTFSETVLVHPLAPGNYTVTATLINCGQPIAAGATSFTQGSDYLVAFGAGSAGIWSTEFTVSSTIDQPSTVIVSRQPTQFCPPLIDCHTVVTVPARGTVVVQNPYGTGVGAVYIGTTDSPAVPSVLARAYAPSIPGKSVDIPVFRVATLLNISPQILVFPGAKRGETGRSNLVVANVADPNKLVGDSVELQVEAFDVHGTSLARDTLSLDYGNTRFLADIVGSLGVSTLDDGQLSITKVGGQGVFWAVMPISRSDGSLSMSLGVAP